MTYTVPLNIEKIFRDLEKPSLTDYFESDLSYEDVDLVELERSVSQFLELIILSKCGEYYYDTSFGFKFWDNMYNTISIESFESNMPFNLLERVKKTSNIFYNKVKKDLRKEDFIKQLQLTIGNYEMRLTEVKITMNLETDLVYKDIYNSLKIIIKGKLIKKYDFSKEFLVKIGPIEKQY